MSYMRGNYYLWCDSDDYLHIWAADGYDGWDDAIWAMDEHGQRRHNRSQASGVRVPLKIMDAFVMMRLAQLIDEGLVNKAIEAALASSGNFGCETLRRNTGILKTALESIRLDQSPEQAT
jgi:hypothetical protein